MKNSKQLKITVKKLEKTEYFYALVTTLCNYPEELYATAAYFDRASARRDARAFIKDYMEIVNEQ